jgi:hypothetical protein
VVAPAFAWNDFGHMVVASVAYSELDKAPAIRAKVDALLQLNPAYSSWVGGVPSADRGEVAFIMASRWPDAIKADSNYVDDGKDNGETPVEPVASRNIGYKDKARHKYWHHKDIGFSTDGTTVEPPKVPNIATAIKRFTATLASPRASQKLKSYDLTWLIHLVGDAHQPLHATARFTTDRPHGDIGGNTVALCAAPCRDGLHAFWDDVLGRSESPSDATAVASALPPPGGSANVLLVDTWLDESLSEAKVHVYVPPIGADGTGPFTITDAYRATAEQVAKQRVALAGARLAALIRDALK